MGRGMLLGLTCLIDLIDLIDYDFCNYSAPLKIIQKQVKPSIPLPNPSPRGLPYAHIFVTH